MEKVVISAKIVVIIPISVVIRDIFVVMKPIFVVILPQNVVILPQNVVISYLPNRFIQKSPTNVAKSRTFTAWQRIVLSYLTKAKGLNKF
jgi:hypothetical protein